MVQHVGQFADEGSSFVGQQFYFLTDFIFIFLNLSCPVVVASRHMVLSSLNNNIPKGSRPSVP